MSGRILAAAVFIAIAAVVIFVGVVASQGAPGTPGVTITPSLNPADGAQTVSFQFTALMYSTPSPNTIWLEGQHVTFSVWQNGKIVVSNQTVALTVISSSGFVYTVQGSADVTLPQVCSGSGCAAAEENVTVSSYVIVQSWLSTYQSPTSVATFYANAPLPTQPVGAPNPATPGAPDPAGWYLELFVPLTVAGLLISIAAIIVRPNWYTGGLAIAFGIAILAEFIVFPLL